MSAEKNQPKDSKEKTGRLSRRDFLRDAGLAVPAISAIPTSVSAESAPESGAASARPELVWVELTVNGGSYRLAVAPHWTLRQLLRDQIGLTSPKDWCGGQGACGSCTVIMNGRPILSCMTLACECNGASVETAEGIAKTNHPIIQAYIDNNAFQCGYCTPGFVCTAKALLDRNPEPTEADVRDALGGNLCRCATYQQHPPAVLEAAKHLKKGA